MTRADIDALGSLSSLTSLDLDGNPLLDLPREAGVLARLTRLTSLRARGIAADAEAMREALHEALPCLATLLV